jgi:exopolyphosphatase/pppGpp-phosphohydrolase
MIARIRSTEDWEIVESVRAPVRLGHSVFTSGVFDAKTLREAAAAFREFRRIMDAHGVTAYRAVTTSAAREARNRHLLIDRIRLQAKINLEVISVISIRPVSSSIWAAAASNSTKCAAEFSRKASACPSGRSV